MRASICGHRSRGGSMAGDSSRSELTLRSSALPLPLMSAHLHIQSLAQESARPVQLGLARALRYTQHLGRLPVRVTIQRVQHQRIARALGQGADRGLDLLHLHRRFERSEEHTSELQSPCNLVCRLLLEKKKNIPLSYHLHAAT